MHEHNCQLCSMFTLLFTMESCYVSLESAKLCTQKLKCLAKYIKQTQRQTLAGTFSGHSYLNHLSPALKSLPVHNTLGC